MTQRPTLTETIGTLSVAAGTFGPEDVRIRSTRRPGDLGAVIALHGLVYETEFGFGPAFEPFVAKTIAEFALDNEARGRLWMAEAGGALLGCTAIVDRDEGQSSAGQLRWVVVHPAARGLGLGRKLTDLALAYCRERGHARVYLETTDGLAASMRLYEKLGFRTIREEEEDLWRERRKVITMEMEL